MRNLKQLNNLFPEPENRDTRDKAKEILTDPMKSGIKITGVVLTDDDGTMYIVNKGAVTPAESFERARCEAIASIEADYWNDAPDTKGFTVSGLGAAANIACGIMRGDTPEEYKARKKECLTQEELHADVKKFVEGGDPSEATPTDSN